MLQLDQQATANGVTIRVTQGLRTWQEQAALYSRGRTGPGDIVTNAQPGYSWHNFGLACDFVPMDSEGQPIWNTAHHDWSKVIALAPGVGLVSGSTWTHFVDFPHLQPDSLPVSPSDEDRQIFLDAGMGSVWAKYASVLGA